MKTLYTIKATSVGGRNGHVRSDYNLIDADVRLPKALGGKDDEHLTPEVFFAAGYAACFDNAVMHIIRMEKVISEQPVVTAKVDLLYLGSGLVGLAVELLVEIPGLDHEIATELVRKAHQICPYSNATRGNIEVKLTIK
jgi:osmotically inducible protein OsmC